MAEAVKPKKTTKRSKTKHRDKENVSTEAKDIGVLDIKEDAGCSVSQPDPVDRMLREDGKLPTVDSATLPVERSFAADESIQRTDDDDGAIEQHACASSIQECATLEDAEAPTGSNASYEETGSRTVVSVGLSLSSVRYLTDDLLTQPNVISSECADLSNASVENRVPALSLVSRTEQTGAMPMRQAETERSFEDDDAEEMESDVCGSRQHTESQLTGHLGTILAESFAHASAPEQLVSTEAVIGSELVEKASAVHSTSAVHSALAVHSDCLKSSEQGELKKPTTVPVLFHRKLYPSLAVENAEPLHPFTDEQLRTLYYNHELEHIDESVDVFLQIAQQEKHEFYEIVRNYYRARNHLSGSEYDIDAYQKEAKKYQDLTWEVATEKISVQGFCQDKYRVVGDLIAERAVFKEDSCSQLDRMLKSIRNHIHDDLSLYAYEAQLSRLQVESYLSRLYDSHQALSDIPPNYPVEAYLAHQRNPVVTHQVEALKSCISVLFAFQRKPTKDDIFTKDVRQWLSITVGTLLRLAALEDHLFLLNHVLRCPAGVGKWAVSFIQPVAPPVPTGETSWGGPLLDHFTSMLALILLPIRQREDLLYQLKFSFSTVTEATNDGQWILVDSDGEEDEDPSNSWHYLQENDLVCLLNQFPLHQIFNHILLTRDHNGDLTYDASRSSETSLLRLFAYATCIIRILSQGLKNFTLGRYRQLNKRIGRMIKHIVQYTCDHWMNFRSVYSGLSPSTLERLQLESDMVLQRAVECILSACRLGSWQFLTELPYKAISITTLWNLFRIMHHGCYKMNVGHPVSGLAIELCRQELTDPVNQAEFHDKLTRLQTSEALFLLNTFSNMARSRSEADREFIEFVSGEIHEIAYVSSHTREFCSKPGRELLATICARHPSAMSFLLHRTKHNMDKIGMVSHYLYRGLPVHLWHPTDADVVVLRHWLLECDARTAENQLARILIEQMNWTFNPMNDGLFLEHSLHQQMAALLMDVTNTHLAGKAFGKLFTDGQKQLSPSGKVADNHQLANWIWSTALRLHLHSRSMSQTGSLLRVDVAGDALIDLASDIEFQSIVSGLLSENRVTLASYFVLMMSKCGHSMSEFLTEGVQHLSHLVEKSYFIPAIQCFYYITPMFFDNLGCLMSNRIFMQCVQTVLQTDSSRKSYFSFDSSCPVAHTFSSMIQNQITTAAADGKPVDIVISFWLRLLTELTNWDKEREVIYVIDSIIKSSFQQPEAFDEVQKIFLELTRGYARDTGSSFLSSLTSWLGSSGKIQSLMEHVSQSEFVWFAFVVLVAETYHLETESNVWRELQKELIQNPSLPVDQALSKTMSSLKLNSSFTAPCLGIYRWANQAVDTPVDHPLLPMIWQQFMLAYLGRCVIEAGFPQRGSVGERFFVTSSHISLMKRMKKRLKESADHYRQLLTQNASSISTSGQSQEMTLSPEACLLYEQLVKLNLTLSFWLDEPRLHDNTLYIPALPEQYQGPLLVSVFQCQMDYWRGFVDMEVIRRDLDALAEEWSTHLIQPQPNSRSEQGTRAILENEESVGSLVSRLERNQMDVVAPPPVQTLRSSVPDLNPALLLDKQNLLYTLRADFETMVDHAKLYSTRVAKHVDLDCTFIELLHRLFVNVITEGVLTVPCRSAFNPTHRCKGPAVITCQYENRRRDEVVNRKIEENRASYKQLLIESLLTPPQNLCGSAVRVENAITGLVNLRHSSETKKEQLILIGTALFYVMTSYVSEDTKFYPPTRQFFSSCVELLGQEFIRNNPSQSQALLQTILQTPLLVGLLAPNFCPNTNPELFVTMYEDMMNVPNCQGVDVAFTLLTKFDIPQWLESNRPLLSRRTTLIEFVFRALCLCGQEPNASLKLVFQVYRVHLQQLLRYQFPDHYGIILKLLLKGSLNAQLCPSVWKDFLICLDCKQRSNSLEGFSYYQKSSTSTTPCILPRPQIKECMEFLSSYFFRLRVGSDDCITYGLYPKWDQYVIYLAQLMAHLAHDCISTEAKANQSCDNEQVVGDVFRQIMDLFTPWVLPLNNNGQILLPWTLSDMSTGAEMVAGWIDSVDLLHCTFEGRLPLLSSNVLSLVWSQYVTSFTVKGLPEHLLRVVHDRLVLLPWKKFYPDLPAVELMVKVIDLSKNCFEFLGNIFTLLNWPSIMKFYCSHELTEITTRLHVCLFTLLVHLAQETVILENTDLPKILSSDVFDWNFLDGQNYQSVVQWFINVCQPQCVLIEKTANGSLVLTLLKKAASFYPKTANAVEHPETPVKRCFYVRCVIQLLCRSSYLKDSQAETLGIVLNNLMTEVESLVASIEDPQSQHHEAIVLSTELLCLFNNCNPQGNMSADLLQMALQWIESSALSVLLMPLMTSACRCLASMAHMVVIVEACVDTHFSVDVSQMDGFGWTKVLSVLQVPEPSLNDFLKTAVQQGSYLTLYAYVLQRLPLSQSLSDELLQLNKLTEWNTNAKPSAENEAKLLLWWQKIIELCQRQIDFGGDQRTVVKSLLLLVSSLTTLGEDKSSTGFFGAIGLGKRSSLSLRFRLVAKGLGAFLAAQIPSDLSLRLASNAPGYVPVRGSLSPPGSPSTLSPSQQALQALTHLESLKTNRQYTGFKQHIELLLSIICNPRNSFRDALPVLTRITSPLFPEFFYLAAIHRVPV